MRKVVLNRIFSAKFRIRICFNGNACEVSVRAWACMTRETQVLDHGEEMLGAVVFALIRIYVMQFECYCVTVRVSDSM